MKNPFIILGIDERVTDLDVVKDVEGRINSIQAIKEDCEKIFRNSQKAVQYRGRAKNFFRNEIEEDLAEKFACQIAPDSKFMNSEELSSIIEKINSEGKGDIKDTFYSNAVMSQMIKIEDCQRRYQKIIDEYKKNPQDEKAKEALENLYISLKYEDSVAEIGSYIARRTPRTFNVEVDKDAYAQNMKNSTEYLEIKEAYEKIGTQKARNDLIPELYVTSRLGNPNLLESAEPEWKEYILNREQEYFFKFVDDMGASQQEAKERKIAENQDHDYGWGIVIDTPSMVMKGIEVDNSDFQGRISVEHLGYFSSESLFNKRKLLRDKHENIEISKQPIKMNGEQMMLTLKKHSPQKNIPKNMREYYYRNVATMQLFNNIYKVSKTNYQGIKREDIVFSPVGKEELLNKYPEEFLTNVYFSNYALDIAKENGGFAGAIVNTPNGLSISTVYNKAEIASSILYQADTEGRIMDLSGKGSRQWRDARSHEANMLLKYGRRNARERESNE